MLITYLKFQLCNTHHKADYAKAVRLMHRPQAKTKFRLLHHFYLLKTRYVFIEDSRFRLDQLKLIPLISTERSALVAKRQEQQLSMHKYKCVRHLLYKYVKGCYKKKY